LKTGPGSRSAREGIIRGFVLRRLAQHATAIFDQYGNGATFEQLAEQFSCSWQTIRRFLIANEIPLRALPRKLKLDPFATEVIDGPALSSRPAYGSA
jgi:hypothetical protein